MARSVDYSAYLVNTALESTKIREQNYHHPSNFDLQYVRKVSAFLGEKTFLSTRVMGSAFKTSERNQMVFEESEFVLTVDMFLHYQWHHCGQKLGVNRWRLLSGKNYDAKR